MGGERTQKQLVSLGGVNLVPLGNPDRVLASAGLQARALTVFASSNGS